VSGERGLIQRAQVHRNEGQALVLETGEDFADEAALDGIGLEQDKSAI